MTHDYDNQSSQDERRELLKDTYLNRAAADADLASSGRFKRETTTKVTGVPSYPQLPPSSPWANGFDQNVEPELGYAVDERPQEIQSSEPALSPATVASPDAGDRTGEGSAAAVVNFPATAAAGSTVKRRGFGE